MLQGRLTTWVKTTLDEPHVHFVLDKDHHTRFLRRPPADARHVASISIRVAGWQHTLELWRLAEATTHDPAPRVNDKSFLVSTIQKAVRRACSSTAASAALELAHVDPISLARRLPIVAVEDVCADHNLGAAVWLMLAIGRGVTASCEDIVWMVMYTTALSQSASHDARFTNGTVPSFSSAWRRATTSDDQVAMALIVRAAFGGMKGDVDMLLRAAMVDQTNAPKLVIPKKKVPRLLREHVILDAVDFHCEPAMLEEISKVHGVDCERVRAAIWHNASKLNVRCPDAKVEEVELWNRIMMDVRRMQRNRVARVYAKL